MPGSTTAPGRAGARSSAPVRIAFRQPNGVGTRDDVDFAAQWLAYAIPYRRFAEVLADNCARLGADVVCYTFIAADLHHLLLAGLPAHSVLDPELSFMKVESICNLPIPQGLSESGWRVLLLPDAGKLSVFGPVGKRSPEGTGRFRLDDVSQIRVPKWTWCHKQALALTVRPLVPASG
jgi:hypothetical protein